MAEYEQAVFISYAWGGERENIVNQIDETLQRRGIKIIRDKRTLGYKGSIKEFMERIGQGNCVIVVISDKYLRSPNCMFELVEIADNKQFHDRIFPIVLGDANIYDPIKRIEYVEYWEAQRADLATAMKKLDPANLQGIRDDMDQYDRIRDNISGITSILKDMNTLTPEIHQDSDFSHLYEAIISRLEKRQAETPSTAAKQESASTTSSAGRGSVGTAVQSPGLKLPLSKGMMMGIAAFVIVACLIAIFSLGSPEEGTPTATEVPTQAATQAEDVNVSLPTAAPTEAAVPTPVSLPTLSPFHVEEFNDAADLDHWTQFLTNGKPEKLNLHLANGKLSFDITGNDVWAYAIYDTFTYTDVRLDAVAINLGINNNNVTLICGYSDLGWYEFNIHNDGQYDILAYNKSQQFYDSLADGGSNAIKTGQAVNKYTVTCQGNTLSLLINDKQVRTVKTGQYHFDQGKIGIAVSSFDAIPVTVQFESVSISQP